ncbi:DUF6624 domain-containing protein [Rufibacter tibetensis]|uniref:Uncharacterized protein n=1 Tax=Rufibacter tibetensis TaxID=512763 RepID=A0A0P0CUJ1_9BACT|nr:DUF6624 domain-containing protein [Rufibacter tibetensis]ALI98034.1 hypothetical protein DC20_02390 [Rufibacter tibetensis]
MRKAVSLLLLSWCSIMAGCGQTEQKAPVPVPYDVLSAELEKIHDVDQSVRQGFNDVKEEDRNAFFLKMRQVDSVNQLQVQKILQQYGWLPKSKIGKKASDGLFLVVQHAPSAVIEKYLPELQEMAQKGEASRTSAAMMEDRLLMFQGKKQMYGTQATSMNREDGSNGIWPIADSKNVNARRKAVGFRETVEEYAVLLNATYNPTEELLHAGRMIQ